MKFSPLVTLFLSSILLLNGCAYWRFDPYHVLLRSDIILSAEDERKIVSKARLDYTEDGRVRVLYVQGTPYERGYQHGFLLRKDIQDNLGTMYTNMLKKFHSKELFAEAFERLRPFIPEAYLQEMHGLAHGSKLPIEVIHHIHALPSITEWGGKKRLKEIAKGMIAGEDLGTSCSNFSVMPQSSDEKMFTVRILDWGLHRISKLHEYPLITVARPEHGEISANIGWVGFIGAVSGMNAAGITLGEMGYGDPANESLRGKPMIFLLREVLDTASSLSDVRRIISESPGTNSFGFLMSDGKTREAELYIRDRDRFLVFQPGSTVQDGEEVLPGINNVVYGGHYEERLHEKLQSCQDGVPTDSLMNEIIPYVAMKSNFQNVVYFPSDLVFWVNNARNKDARAAEQVYTRYSLAEGIQAFPDPIGSDAVD